MSMLKKTAALTVSAVLLLQPMTASAVTWNNIVNGLRNSWLEPVYRGWNDYRAGWGKLYRYGRND